MHGGGGGVEEILFVTGFLLVKCAEVDGRVHSYHRDSVGQTATYMHVGLLKRLSVLTYEGHCCRPFSGHQLPWSR